MLFLNRRGYAPLTLCRHCGHRMRCPNCTAWLVEHRCARRLQCHHCGHADAAARANARNAARADSLIAGRARAWSGCRGGGGAVPGGAARW